MNTLTEKKNCTKCKKTLTPPHPQTLRNTANNHSFKDSFCQKNQKGFNFLKILTTKPEKGEFKLDILDFLRTLKISKNQILN